LKSLFAIVVAILMVFTVFLVITPAVALPNENASDKAKERAASKVSIPENAVKIAPGIYDIGEAKDVSGKTVKGLMFIDYKKEFAKPAGTPGKGPKGGGNGGDDTEITCFSIFTKGATWRTPEPYVLDPENSDSYSESQVISKIAESMSDWESEAGVEIFGDRDTGNTFDGVDTLSPDGKNEIVFGSIAEQGAIAATLVWYEKTGKPSQRDILEYDIIFDDNDYLWGKAGTTDETNLGNPNIMDYHNIAAHEIGHAAGLSHPDNSCSEETMYFQASQGETKKRTLHDGDIDGIKDLY